MKDIYEILKDCGIEVPEDKKEAFGSDFHKNYKTIVEMQKKDESISNLTDQLNTAKAGLSKFDGVNVDEMKNQIATLTNDLTRKDEEYKAKIAGIEFDNDVESAITAMKGKNAKAIRALLDVDKLKASANRKEDVKAELEAIKKDNGYLFDEEATPAPFAGGTGSHNPKESKYDKSEIDFRRGAGLPID